MLALAVLLLVAPADAHVGSPNVFLEGDAGPYHLFVTVNVPAVIPGVADVQIRADSDDVHQISTAVTRLAGAGSKYAPVPDLAQRSPVDPHLFTSSLWLMEYGSMRVLINVAGVHGAAQMSVPVPSAARRMLPMPPALGALLLLLAIGLAVGAISIVGAAARESRLPPGAPVTPELRRRGWRAMAIMGVIAATIFQTARPLICSRFSAPCASGRPTIKRAAISASAGSSAARYSPARCAICSRLWVCPKARQTSAKSLNPLTR